MTVPEALLAYGGQVAWAGFIVFLRVGAFMAFLPAFGEQTVPVRVRIGLTLAFTFALLPMLQDELQPDATNWPAPFPFPFLITEVVAGLAFGAAVRLMVHALQIAGSIAAQSTSLSQILGASVSVDPQPAIGQVMLVAGLALLAIGGLHLRLVEYMLLSYTLFPPGRMPAADVLGLWGVQRVAAAFGLAFSLAAPFVIAAFLYNLTLGVINRAMPQLMVAFVGAPVITAGGLGLLALSMPLVLGLWSEAVHALLSAPERISP